MESYVNIQSRVSVIINKKLLQDVNERTVNCLLFDGLVGEDGRRCTSEKIDLAFRIFETFYLTEYDLIILDVKNEGFRIELIEDPLLEKLCYTDYSPTIKTCGITARKVSSGVENSPLMDYIIPVIVHHPELDGIAGNIRLVVPIRIQTIIEILTLGLFNGTLSKSLSIVLTSDYMYNYDQYPFISGFFKDSGRSTRRDNYLYLSELDYQRNSKKTKNLIQGHLYLRGGSVYSKLLYLGEIENIIVFLRTRCDDVEYLYNMFDLVNYSPSIPIELRGPVKIFLGFKDISKTSVNDLSTKDLIHLISSVDDISGTHSHSDYYVQFKTSNQLIPMLDLGYIMDTSRLMDSIKEESVQYISRNLSESVVNLNDLQNELGLLPIAYDILPSDLKEGVISRLMQYNYNGKKSEYLVNILKNSDVYGDNSYNSNKEN